MSLHVIVGAGPVGAATARVLAERGEQVRIVSRRGVGPEHPAIERVAADAADAAAESIPVRPGAYTDRRDEPNAGHDDSPVQNGASAIEEGTPVTSSWRATRCTRPPP